MWLQSSMREPWRLQYLKSVILETSIVTLWLVFPNPVTHSIALNSKWLVHFSSLVVLLLLNNIIRPIPRGFKGFVQTPISLIAEFSLQNLIIAMQITFEVAS